MNRPAEPTPEGAELALAIYVEELARAGRVLWMGEPGPGAARLAERAPSLEVLPPPRRSRGQRRGQRLPQRGWLGPADAGVYRLVVVPDALAAGLADAGRLGDVARSLTDDGVVVLCTEAREGSYERFHEHVAAGFAAVRMLGISAFSGACVVDFAAADGAGVSLDGSALSGAPPEPVSRWVAIASRSEVALEPMLVVQLPASARAASDAEVAPAAPAATAAPSAPLERANDRAIERPVERTNDRAPAERELDAARARLEHAEKRLEQAQREIARNAQKLDELRHDAERAATALAERDRALADAEKRRATLEGARERAADAALDGELASEVRGLEARLAAQGRELTELRIEAERRARLVRDLVEELARARTAAAGVATGAVPAAPVSEPVRSEPAQRRVADAEAARAAAGFRADELQAELSVVRSQLEAERGRVSALEEARRRDAAAASAATERAAQAARAEGAAELARALGERERMAAELTRERALFVERERMAAEREGTVRGLLSRAAELNEMRLQTEGRLALAESDLSATRAELRHLQAELGRAQEELELALLQRGHGLGHEGAASAAERAALAAELSGARAERAQLEAELARLRSALVLAEHERESEREAGIRRAASLEVERDAASASAHAAGHEVARLREALGALEAERPDVDALVGERDGLRLRLRDAEAALAEHLARAAAASDALAELEEVRRAHASLSDETSDTRTALESLRAEHGTIAARLTLAERERDAERARVAGLIARLAARDGLVQSRQSLLAQAAERERELVARTEGTIAALAARLEASNESLAALEAVAAVRADEERRQGGELEARLREAEAAGTRARSRVRAARAALEEIRTGLAHAVEGQRLVLSEGAVHGSPREVERMRRELDDRELMLRSLTAQLEERDDRLRALERAHGGAPMGDLAELRHALLVAQEREARLVTELEAASRRRGSEVPAERLADLRRLEQLLSDRESHAMQVEGALAAARREEQILREVIAQTRTDVESALAGVGIEPPGDTAERLAEALRLLHRL